MGCLGKGFLGKPLSCAVNLACGREEECAIGDTSSVCDIVYAI
ncbi:hypothetical protein [Mahella australiensis]|nr:hypothetical protein [Mahella australiensis]